MGEHCIVQEIKVSCCLALGIILAYSASLCTIITLSLALYVRNSSSCKVKMSRTYILFALCVLLALPVTLHWCSIKHSINFMGIPQEVPATDSKNVFHLHSMMVGPMALQHFVCWLNIFEEDQPSLLFDCRC